MSEQEKEFYSKSADSKYGKKIKQFTRTKEAIIKLFFTLNGVAALIFIILIFIFLFKEGFRALEHIGLLDFISTTRVAADGTAKTIFEWYPTSDEPRYSLIPLILGTLMTAIPATIISTILGVAAGIYLSEIANPKWKEFLKPMIELVAGIPSVVVGCSVHEMGIGMFTGRMF